MRKLSDLNPADAADLQWYFGRGQTAFEHSTMGPMLQYAELYAVHIEWWKPLPEVTAYPTAEVRAAAGYVPDDITLTKYAEVSRTLQGVAKSSTISVYVLQGYWGDAGDRFSLSSYGRLLGLYHLTAAGRRLLKSVADKHPGQLPMPAHERMAVEVELQRVKPTAKRCEALMLADRESEVLYTTACREWNVARAHERGDMAMAC
jgi:hypothetical protein